MVTWRLVPETRRNIPQLFGSAVFNDDVMQERLPKDVYKSLRKTIDEGKDLDLAVANAVANAMKDWAVEKGATHYTHWFQPLNGITAEKARQLHLPHFRRESHHAVLRQGAHQRGARRPPPSPPAACGPPLKPGATPPGTLPPTPS